MSHDISNDTRDAIRRTMVMKVLRTRTTPGREVAHACVLSQNLLLAATASLLPTKRCW